MRIDDKPTHNFTLADDDEDLYGDADRYLTAAQPDPEPKSRAELKKLGDKYLREHEERFAPSAFESRTANAAIRRTRKTARRKLYGDLWLQGELVVLTGPPASGKTILATQIAETIARGGKSDAFTRSVGEQAALPAHAARLVRTGNGSDRVPVATKQLTTDNRPLTTVLLDLEHTDAAITERYTVKVPFCPRKTKTYRFSPHLKRPDVQTLDIPEAYQGRYLEWMIHSLHRIIEDTDAQVIVIDNITLLDNTGRTDRLTRLLHYLRRLAHEDNLSILVTYPLPERSQNAASKPFRLYPSAFRLLSAADKVLAILPTTIAPDHRYLKVVKGGSPDSNNEVHVFCLERSESPGSPPYEGGVAAASADGVVLPETPHSPNSANSANSPNPAAFLGLTYLGLSPERLHLIDYQAQARQLYPRSPGRSSKKDEVVEMLLDPAYGRYLKGEK